MGVEASLRRVCELVESAEVSHGERFTWNDPDQGAVADLVDAIEGVDRLFDIAGVRAIDGGEGGCVPARVRILATLRIRYRVAGSAMGRAVQQAEDVRLIRDAIMFDPAAWSYSTTGLLSVLCDESTGPESLGALDPADDVHEIITIPLTLEVDP
jgi:hypothetical protein